MSKAENQSNFYRYVVSACDILFSNGESIKTSDSHIIGFTIEKDFDNCYFPIFNLKLSLSDLEYYKIVKDKTNVRFKVKIEKFAYNENNTMYFKETVLDGLFATFIDADDSYFDEELYKQTIAILGNAENLSERDFYLFKETDMKSSKKIFNKVVSSANMLSCVTYLLSASGASNVLITPFDNTSIYKEILLPPVSVIKSIEFLERQFGFYNHGKILFYDFNTIYFINKRAKCTAYRTGEYKEVIVDISKTTSTNTYTPGNYKDTSSKSYILHIQRENIAMETQSIVSDQITGTNVNVIDTYENSITKVTPDIRNRNNNTTVVVNNYNNKYLTSMIENEKYENDHIINANVIDIDILCLTPNKRFAVSFEDKKVSVENDGNYRLSYMIMDFAKNGDYFTVTGQMQLKKTT